MNIRQIDHVSLHVKDVEASAAFYAGVLQLERLPRPKLSVPGAWFRIGQHQQLHLIGGRTEEIHSAMRGNHFAVEVDDIQSWERHLRDRNIPFDGPSVRPDGATQIFLKDPEGHVVEFYEQQSPQ